MAFELRPSGLGASADRQAREQAARAARQAEIDKKRAYQQAQIDAKRAAQQKRLETVLADREARRRIPLDSRLARQQSREASILARKEAPLSARLARQQSAQEFKLARQAAAQAAKQKALETRLNAELLKKGLLPQGSPQTVSPLDPSYPQPVPITTDPSAAVPMPVPGGAMPYSGPESYSATMPWWEDVPEEELYDTEDYEEFDAGFMRPNPTSPAAFEEDAEAAQEEWIDDQTNFVLNQTSRRSRSSEDDDWSMSGLGRVFRSTPGYRQTSIMKRTLASRIDAATNPRRGLRRRVIPRGFRTHPSQVNGIMPETAEGNIGLGVAGGLAYAASDLLPSNVRPIVKVGAIGAMLIGGVKVLKSFFQVAAPASPPKR